MFSRKILSLTLLTLCAVARAQEVPLVASYPMEPNAQNSRQLIDVGPLKLNGTIDPDARFVPDKVGQALQFAR